MGHDDSIEGVRPATGELAPEVWAARLLDELEPNASNVADATEEPVGNDEDDEADWAAAIAAAHARTEREESAEPAAK